MDGVILIDLDPRGHVVRVDGPAVSALGGDTGYLLGRTLPECVNPGDMTRLDEGLRRGVAPGGSERGTIVRLLDVEGRSVWVELSVRDRDQRTGAVVTLHAKPFHDRTPTGVETSDPNPYHALVQESADIVMIVDPAGIIGFVNTAMQRLLEAEPDDLVGTQVLDIIHPGDHDAVTELVVRLLDDPARPQPFEFRARHADGSYRWVDGWLQNLLDHPDVGGLLGNSRDVTDRHHAQVALSASEARFRSLASSSPSAIFELDDTGVVRFANTRWYELTGRAVTGAEDIFAVLHPEDAERLRAAWEHGSGRTGLDEDVRVIRADGKIRRVELRTRPVPGGDSSGLDHVGSLHDVTELRDMHTELEYLATHDSLTHLPNRGRLLDRLDAAISAARDTGDRLALLFVDLDRFKIVNDSLGHHAGDQVLLAVAGRLADLVRPMDLVARFGGDEFVVLCAPIVDEYHAANLADRIRREVAGGVRVDGELVHVTVSVGFVTGDGTSTAESLLRDADAAMYEAKTRGRDRAQAFDDAIHRAAVERLEMEAAMRRGLERDEFHLYFQPILGTRSARVHGVEALLRWDHPERGLLAPDDFLAVAEESGVLAQLGDWLLTAACGEATRWTGPPDSAPPKLFVNLAATQLDDPLLVSRVGGALGETGLDPDRLVLEVTEGMLMGDPDEMAGVLHALRDLGVHIAIDDFGTGYSSLSYLTRLPVDVLKIDRSFVAGLEASTTDREVASAVIALTRALALQTVAEGVETDAQLGVLTDLGCDLAQGFLFSEPLSGDQMLGWLADHEARSPR